jgi:hypothetical protein
MLTALVDRGRGGEVTRHRVRDLSSGGVRIDNAGGLQAGESVSVSVGALQAIAATVKWTRKDFAGLAFAEQVDPSDAHKKAAVAPAVYRTPIQAGMAKHADVGKTAPPLTVGWLAEMRNPYKK